MSKSVLVETDEEGVQPLRLKLAFTIQPLVVADPPSRASVDAVVGGEGTTEVRLRRRDGKPLEIGSITSNPAGLLEVTVAPPNEGQPADERSLILKVTPQSSATVRIVTLSIATNLSKRPVMTYPVAVRVHPVVEAEPHQVRFILGGPGATADRIGVRLIDNRGRGFRVRSLESSNPELFVATAEGESEESNEHRVTVALAPNLQPAQVPGVVRGQVTITTDDPGERQLTIPVFVARASGTGHPPVRGQQRRMLRPAPRPSPAVPVPYQGGSR